MSTVPETFKTICESVLEESDGRGVQLDSVSLDRDTNGDLYLTNPTHRNIVSWVAEEYVRIQMDSPLADFMHKRGVFLNLAVDKASYIKSGVRRLDSDSLYFVKTGEVSHYPLITQPYEWWQYEQRDGIITAASTPTTIIKAPGDEWIVWPTPTAVGVVKGDWNIIPFELVNADDKPCWDKRFNPLLKWGVIELYAAEFAGEKSAPKLQARARRMLPSLRSAFEDEHCPPVRGAATFF